MSAGHGWGRRDRLGGGGCRARRRGDVGELLVIGRDSLDDRRVRDGGVGDDGGLKGVGW